MFIRRIRKYKNNTEYDYWALIKTVRTVRGPRQKVVGWIGKTFELDKEEQIGWENIEEVLNDDSTNNQSNFFTKKKLEYEPDWKLVDIKGIKVERIRQFGNVYLGLWIWKKLMLDKIFNEIQPQGREEIRWSSIYCILTIARLCNPSSELHIAEHWYDKTALDDLTGVSEYKINEDRLYRALDHILKHKDEISRHLQDRYTDLFGIGFEFLIYDVTSVYFEGQCKRNPQAKRGYSRDKRTETDPKIIWKMYMHLNQAESSFRIGKSDLRARPIYHQTEKRVQAHIFVCFLALCLWRTLEQITQGKGIGDCVRKLLNEMSEIRSMDIILPVKDRSPLRLRLVAKPEDHIKELIYRLNLKLPNQPKILAEIPSAIVNPAADIPKSMAE